MSGLRLREQQTLDSMLKWERKKLQSFLRRVKRIERRVMKVEDNVQITSHEILIELMKYCKKIKTKQAYQT